VHLFSIKEVSMFKKLKEILFKQTVQDIPVRMEHVDSGTQGLIVVWSDDKQTKLATFPDIVKPHQLEKFLKDNHYKPVEYFASP
jgi:hypothetical protein